MLKMGSHASAENGGDQEDEETATMTDKSNFSSSSSPTNLKDGHVKEEGGKMFKVKSEDCKKIGLVKHENFEEESGVVICEDYKIDGQVEVKRQDLKDIQKVMMVKLDLEVKLGEKIKSEENVKMKTEDQIKKIDIDDENEVVDVGEEESNLEDSVNITEMPTEGPQEMEEEQKEELSKDVESVSSSPMAINEEKDNDRDNDDQCSLDERETTKITEEEKEKVEIDDKQRNQDEIVEGTGTTTTISSGSTELQFEGDVNEDVREAVECIANQVASENILSPLIPPVAMETETEEEDDSMAIPEEASPSPSSPVSSPGIRVAVSELVVPAPETVLPVPEIVVTPPEEIVPIPKLVIPELVDPVPETVVRAPDSLSVPPPPLVEVDPGVAHLKKEMNRLQAALIWERGSKAELSSKLKKSQEELALKTKNLTVAENKLWERSTAAASLVERDLQLKTLQDSFDKMKEEKDVLQGKYDHLKNSLGDIGKEFYGIYETLQNHFKICTVNGPEMVPLTPHEALQRRVDDLTTSVHERYKFWNAEQQKMSEELGDTKKTMEELIDFLEVAEEKKPPPPPEKADRSTSPIISPKQSKHQKKKKKELKCDLCRNSFSNATILKRHRKSCGDAVAGTSSSSNPATPAPAPNDSDSDDIAIIEDDDDDNPPVSPTPTVIDSSSDENLASPSPKVKSSRKPSSTTIHPPLSSPPIVMSKIAMSFAPPSVPSSPRSKRRRSSSGIQVVQEVEKDVDTTSKHTRTRKRQVDYQDEEISAKPSAKRPAKSKEIPTPPGSPPQPPSPPPPSSPPKKKKKSKAKIIGHAEDTTKELTCTCGRDFINKYHLKTHIEKEAANSTTPAAAAPTPPEKPAKVAVVMMTNISHLKAESKPISHKINDSGGGDAKTGDKTKKRTIAILDDEPNEPKSPEETNLRSSKRLKKIKDITPTLANDDAPASPSPLPRTRKQNGGGPARSPRKSSTKTVDVTPRSPKKSPKKGMKGQDDRSSKKVVHEQDYSKSARRGLFCKCGLNFQSRRKLNIHLFCREKEEKKETGNESGNAAFNCTSCGENFVSNAERIRHRMLAHGHGLNS